MNKVSVEILVSLTPKGVMNLVTDLLSSVSNTKNFRCVLFSSRMDKIRY